MSAIRERKPASAADKVTDAAPATAATAAAVEPAPAFSSSPLRFLPFVALFLAIFLGISYASSGTLHYGLGPHIQRSVNLAKIRVQELAGIRVHPAERVQFPAGLKPKPRPKGATNSGVNGGYGGITPSAISTKNGRPVRPDDDTSDVFGGSAPAGAPPSIVTAPTEEGEVTITPRPAERNPKELYLSLEDLSAFKGEDGSSILLAVYGRIFDVTTGASFYGPKAGYSNLAGKDASRAFATNCYNSQNLHDTRGLTKEQLKSIDGWYKFYNEHKTYRAVGWVEMPEIPADAPLPDDNC